MAEIEDGKLQDKSSEIVQLKLKIAFFMFLVIGTALAIGPSILKIIFPTIGNFQAIIGVCEKIGGAFLAAAFITIITRLFVLRHYKDFEGELQSYLKNKVNTSIQNLQELIDSRIESVEDQIEGSIKKLDSDIEAHTLRLVNQATALSSLHKADVSNVYLDRNEAAIDILKEVKQKITNIQIIGISLNDFVRAGSKLHDIWEIIRQIIENKRNILSESVKIQVLILHPDSLGAELRSVSEHREGSTVAGRLRQDVNITTGHLLDLQNNIIAKGVEFEAKMYFITPSLFMFRTDNTSYIQQYHFWSSRSSQKEMPILSYKKTQEEDLRSIHDQMGDHFSWIWQNASIPVSSYEIANQTGRDKGLIRANCLNVYNNTSSCKKRMLWLLENAQSSIKLLGISLKSFVNETFFDLLQQLANGEKVESVKILILDPECKQAKLRSFREYLICAKECDLGLSYEDYIKQKLHEESDLWRDTTASLRKINDTFSENPIVDVRLYDCSPSCFVFAVDDRIMVEQYHYGKVRADEDQRRILGKDMPVYEFQKDSLFCNHPKEGMQFFPPENRDERLDLIGRKPFELIDDHFNHIWDHYSIKPRVVH